MDSTFLERIFPCKWCSWNIYSKHKRNKVRQFKRLLFFGGEVNPVPIHKNVPSMRKIEIKDLGGGNSNILYFHPYLGKRFPIWLIFFKGDWNCQPVKDAWMCLIKRNYAQQDRDQSDEGGAADDAFLWQLGAASQKKKKFETAPISVWKWSSCGMVWSENCMSS